jgi:cytosine/adenosine deaminase-related metal-dependent hydrolase
MMATYCASWVFTGSGEPIRDGILTVANGQVQSVQPIAGRQSDEDLRPALIIPGLVNAHTHLDLGELRGKLPAPARFTDWLEQIITYRRQFVAGNHAGTTDAAIRAGITESLQNGTTCLGDISVLGSSITRLIESPLRFVAFWEMIGLGRLRADESLRAAEQLLQAPAHSRARLGISPHAPYSVGKSLMKALLSHPRLSQLPAAMHVAESEAELTLLQKHSGEFADFLKLLHVWEPQELLDSLQDVCRELARFPRSLLIHGNYLAPELWQELPGSVSVVYCPRTHEFLGHRNHPYLRMSADGVNVALGTDSLASNPDLSILNEARFLWNRDRPRLSGSQLLQLATSNGARALGWEDVGTLTPGSRADFVVLPCPDEKDDPWQQLWGTATQPLATFIDGACVFRAPQAARRGAGSS